MWKLKKARDEAPAKSKEKHAAALSKAKDKAHASFVKFEKLQQSLVSVGL